MLHNSINLAVASSNKNVSISASDLEKLCDTLTCLDTCLIPNAPALKDDPQQQELYRITRKDLGAPDETIDRLVIMARARRNNFSHAVFGNASYRADYPNVCCLKKIIDWDLFKAVADNFNISYTVE